MINQLFFVGKVLLLSLFISLTIKLGWFNLAINHPQSSALLLVLTPAVCIGLILFWRQKKLFS